MSLSDSLWYNTASHTFATRLKEKNVCSVHFHLFKVKSLSDFFPQQCQAHIKSYFLCMTESDQRVKILKNPDGTPRNFTVR